MKQLIIGLVSGLAISTATAGATSSVQVCHHRYNYVAAGRAAYYGSFYGSYAVAEGWTPPRWRNLTDYQHNSWEQAARAAIEAACQ